MKRFFKNRWVTGVVIILMIVGLILSIFPINLPWFNAFPNYAVSLIFFYLLLGLFFLFLSNSRLVLASFLAAGILSFFLKIFSNENMGVPLTSGTKLLTVSNYNLINLESDVFAFVDGIKDTDSDILCFHEVNPGWERLLSERLNGEYPFRTSLVRIDAFGKMVISKIPISQIDTFYFSDIPGLDVTFSLGSDSINLIVTQIVPPFQAHKGVSSSDQLRNLARYINKIPSPVILAGEFNQVYWSRELRNMVEVTKLLNSRRFISTLGAKVPHEHIFHSYDFECIEVDEIQDNSGAHVGVEASFGFGNGLSLTNPFQSGNRLNQLSR